MKSLIFYTFSVLCFLSNFNSLAQERALFDGENFSSETYLLHPENTHNSNTSIKYEEKKIVIAASSENAFVTLKPIKIDLKNPKPFISSYTIWKGENLYKEGVELSYRTSLDGTNWNNWELNFFDGHFEGNGDQLASAIVFLEVNVKYIQYKIEVLSKEKVIISDIKINQYSPGDTPEKPKRNIEHSTKNNRVVACEKPNVISRSEWGAQYVNGSIFQNTIATHLIVHHEVGANTSNDWAARVRAIQNFHINGNGWSDIGYNFIISPTGTIYEGRAGGDRKIGAHFCGKNSNTMGVCMLGDYSSVIPTNNTQQALANLLAWKANKENIDPEGTSYHYSVGTLNTIAGHRDGGGCTVCPGDGGYSILGNLRAVTGELVDNGCNDVPVDSTNPTTEVSIQGGTTQAGDFTVNFNDNDNVEVTRRYYQVLEKYYDDWFANRGNGFFNDNFNELYSEYEIGEGDWSTMNAHLRQSNTLSENTSLSTFLSQNSDLPYLYEFSAKIISQTGPRKFGLHIIASDYTLNQRGDSYLIWFSGEDNKLRIYKTESNVLKLKETVDLTLDNEWANYKITYSPSFGVIQVFKNNTLVLYWTDTSPITSGNYLSLRTNATAMDFDDLKVYKYRGGNSVVVTAGDEVTKDIRTREGKINSLVRDAVGNWSSPDGEDVVISTILGVEDSKDTTNNNIFVYPNPTDGRRLFLNYNESIQNKLKIYILDFTGKVIHTINYEANNDIHGNINLSRYVKFLQNGYYFIKVDNGITQNMIKMIKK